MQSQETFSEEETKSLHRLNCAVIGAVVLAVFGLISAIAGFLLMFRKSNRIGKIDQLVTPELRNSIDSTRMCSNGIWLIRPTTSPLPRVCSSTKRSSQSSPARTTLETPIHCETAANGKGIRRCSTEPCSITMLSIQCRPRRFNSLSPQSRMPRCSFRRRFLRSFSSRSANQPFIAKEEVSAVRCLSSRVVLCVKRSVPRGTGSGLRRPLSVH